MLGLQQEYIEQEAEKKKNKSSLKGSVLYNEN